MNVLFQFEANIKKKRKKLKKKERNSKKFNCCKKILYNAFMIFIAIINYCEFTCLCIVLINIKCDIPPYHKISSLPSHPSELCPFPKSGALKLSKLFSCFIHIW